MAVNEPTPLAERHCVRCEPGTPQLDSADIGALLGQVHRWTVEEDDGHPRLSKRYKFKGFMPAVEFVNRIAPIAEAEGHHHDLLLSWGSVTVELWTHAAGGLTDNDFILAAKIDQLQLPKS
jgi:4a-hydroxytetrahydrobiopterin dehydratase